MRRGPCRRPRLQSPPAGTHIGAAPRPGIIRPTMSWAVVSKLLAIFCTVVLGWAGGRLRWLGEPVGGTDPARILSQAAFYLFAPALLFRTTARLDPSTLPWSTLLAFFGPVLALTAGLYLWQHRRGAPAQALDGTALSPAQQAAWPACVAVTVFGNSLQVGVPMAGAVFGEAGLGIHIALVSVHALVLLTTLTVMAEVDLARAQARQQGRASIWAAARTTARNAIIHPVVLPVVAGMVWQATGWPLPGPIDETLQLLGTAVAPLCLVLIGMTLAYTPGRAVRAALGAALRLSAFKLLLMPALVLAAAWGVFGLRGLALQVVVLMAALPTGSNTLIFAQRYRCHEGEASATIVLSTLLFALTAPAWLLLLDALGRIG
ncbi:MAG: hypothetical protein RLY78_1567 [Pseudomonadota bacterium]